MQETPYRIQPTSLETVPLSITDLTGKVIGASKALESKLAPDTASSLADLVRVMNCYYSNLIEGHDTRPREIEQALEDGINDSNPERRHLKIEARAHIRLQEKIDEKYFGGTLGEPWDTDFLRWLHLEFYAGATPDMLLVHKSDREVLTLRPGEIRTGKAENVTVGRHIPPSTEVLPEFLADFERRFAVEGQGPAAALIASAISHHRFLYIHPFLDGNGRVARLASHAMLLKAGAGGHGLWSISRGLARGTDPGPAGRLEYKAMLDHADTPRTSDLDGRGNLSQAATLEFVEWWLQVCLDQITFMTAQFDLDGLERRIEKWLREEELSRALGIFKECLRRGEMKRGEAGRVTGMADRTARNHLGALERIGVLKSNTPKGPVHIVFSPATASIFFPALFD